MREKSWKSAQRTLKSALQGISGLKRSIPDLERAKKLIDSEVGDIIVTGIGKSGAIAEKISATLTSLGKRASYLHPVDAIHGDIGALSEGDVLLALSFSGESKEVVKIANYAKKEFEVPIISFTKSKKSALGKISDIVVPVRIDDEGSPGNMAPMTSTTATLVLGDMLASMLVGDMKKDKFARFHPGGSIGLEIVKVESLMKTGSALAYVEEKYPAKKVLKEISKKNLGVTAVIAKNMTLVGIITDGDIRRWLLAGGNSSQDTARDMMTKNPKTVSKNQSLKEALRIMEKHRITTLFVTDRKKVEGIIHIHDIVEGNIV